MTTLADWLKKHHYRESTQRATLRGLNAAKAAFAAGERLPRTAEDAASRVLTYASNVKDAEDLDPAFVEWLRGHELEEVKRLPKEGPKTRVRQAVSLDQARWYKLHDWLQSSSRDGHSREDLVLFVVLRTGLRIGDVLRTPVSRIENGLKTGVIQIERKGGRVKPVPLGDNTAAWKALHAAAKKVGAVNVAQFLCRENPSPLPGDCAYQRANRRIKLYQRKLKCVDSLHLHRLRRTIAVAALRETNGDLIKVQQMLGHDAIASTQRYTDELQVEGIATLQSQLFGKRGTK